MSRRAIISDIHSNLVALEAVLADIKGQDVDEIVCLGDVCGYGPQPMECIDLVRRNAAWTLRGNHDEALFVEPKDFGKNARIAIEWQKTFLEPKPGSTPEIISRWHWLRDLPIQRGETDVLFVHASPRDPVYEYVLKEDFHDTGSGPTQKAKDIFAAMDWLCFCGHSHRPGVVAEDFKWRLPEDLPNGYIVSRGFKTIVNVGSVGQPRDGISTACYCIFEYSPPDHNSTTRIAKAVSPAADTSATRTAISIEERSMLADQPSAANEETRSGEELKQVRDTALLKMPRVRFRRVEYDIAEAQARSRAVPQLPETNALRLAKGV